jgi:hypothetical protein
MLDERNEQKRGPNAEEDFGGDVERPHFATSGKRSAIGSVW